MPIYFGLIFFGVKKYPRYILQCKVKDILFTVFAIVTRYLLQLHTFNKLTPSESIFNDSKPFLSRHPPLRDEYFSKSMSIEQFLVYYLSVYYVINTLGILYMSMIAAEPGKR